MIIDPLALWAGFAVFALVRSVTRHFERHDPLDNYPVKRPIDCAIRAAYQPRISIQKHVRVAKIVIDVSVQTRGSQK